MGEGLQDAIVEGSRIAPGSAFCAALVSGATGVLRRMLEQSQSHQQRAADLVQRLQSIPNPAAVQEQPAPGHAHTSSQPSPAAPVGGSLVRGATGPVLFGVDAAGAAAPAQQAMDGGAAAFDWSDSESVDDFSSSSSSDGDAQDLQAVADHL